MTACSFRRTRGRARGRIRRASTVIELMVTVALLSIVSSVATLALRDVASAPGDYVRLGVTAARERALREGHSVTIRVRAGGRVAVATAFPDGSVVADSVLAVDVSTGRWTNPAAEEGPRAP